MPGVATKFVVADLVFDQIRKNGGPNADLLNDPASLPFAYPGAIGACLGDLLPARPEIGSASPNTPYFQTWLKVLSLFTGTPASGGVAATRGVYQEQPVPVMHHENLSKRLRTSLSLIENKRPRSFFLVERCDRGLPSAQFHLNKVSN